MEYKFKIDEDDSKKYSRIDIFLVDKIKNITRTKIQTAIKNGCLNINGKKILKSNYSIELNDFIEFNYLINDSNKVEPEDIKLDILFEDDYLIVINKDCGITTHPAGIFKSGTLVNALMHYGALETEDGEIEEYEYRPGVVHRLDKDTSGLIIFAKDEETQQKMSAVFKERLIEKKYLAVVYGRINENKGIITYPIARHKRNRKIMCVRNDGKQAITEFTVIDRSNNFSLVELNLKTGRTHQIRVHLKAINHPVVGDNLYSTSKKEEERLMLHSYSAEFEHPILKTNINIVAPLKKKFAEFCLKNSLNLGNYKREN